MCVIVPCRAQFSTKLFVRVSYEDTPPPEVRSRPLVRRHAPRRGPNMKARILRLISDSDIQGQQKPPFHLSTAAMARRQRACAGSPSPPGLAVEHQRLGSGTAHARSALE